MIKQSRTQTGDFKTRNMKMKNVEMIILNADIRISNADSRVFYINYLRKSALDSRESAFTNSKY